MKIYPVSRKWFLVLEPLRYDDEIDYLHNKLKFILNKGFYAFVFSDVNIYVYTESYSPQWILSFIPWFTLKSWCSVKGSRKQMVEYLLNVACECGGTFHSSEE